MVERLTVDQKVAGSRPVGHPFRWQIVDFRLQIAKSTICNRKSEISVAPVAQPDRASVFGTECWGFESLQARLLMDEGLKTKDEC